MFQTLGTSNEHVRLTLPIETSLQQQWFTHSGQAELFLDIQLFVIYLRTNKILFVKYETPLSNFLNGYSLLFQLLVMDLQKRHLFKFTNTLLLQCVP